MWTPERVGSEARPYAGTLWRVVKARHVLALARLVDTHDEEAVLANILERTRPPATRPVASLHPLFAGPFRDAPYPRGSRFRRAGQREGVLYAAEAVTTALAETAFYAALFFLVEAQGMQLPANPVAHTALAVACATERCVDLTIPPFASDPRLLDPVDYTACQALADSGRQSDVGAIRYRSIRDPDAAANVALMMPDAIASPEPLAFETWHALLDRQQMRLWREHDGDTLAFPLTAFARDPRIAALG
jgi:RES domain